MAVTTFTMLDKPASPDRIAPAGRIGLLCLGTDFNTEDEIRKILPGDVGVFTNRIRNANPLTLENLQAMAQDITRTAAGILPGFGVDVMIYACTSGSAAIGSDRIAAAVHQSCPGVVVTNPVIAARAAIRALGARKISILTPYEDSLNRMLAPSIEKDCVEILNMSGLGIDNDIEITAIPLEHIRQAALKACNDKADLLFLSCTAMRGAQVVGQLEQELGRPVLASNQLLAWHALRLLGCQDEVTGFGQIFRCR